VFVSADEGYLITRKDAKKRPPWHAKADCAQMVLPHDDWHTTHV
jgi:hypothetical protein